MEVSFNQAHQQVLQAIEKQAKSRTIRAANVIKKYSNKVLSNSPARTGRVYKRPGTYGKRANKMTKQLKSDYGHKLRGGQLYRASAPGEPPAARTSSGGLRGSWRPLPIGEMAAGGKVYTPGIHTDIPYAPMLKDGTPKMKARPYAEKIKQEAWPEVKQIYEQPYF